MNLVDTLPRPLFSGATEQPYSLALGAHLLACARARGQTFELRCLGERLHDLFAPRFCTTLVAAAALMGLLAGCA